MQACNEPEDTAESERGVSNYTNGYENVSYQPTIKQKSKYLKYKK